MPLFHAFDPDEDFAQFDRFCYMNGMPLFQDILTPSEWQALETETVLQPVPAAEVGGGFRLPSPTGRMVTLYPGMGVIIINRARLNRAEMRDLRKRLTGC